MGVRMIRQRRKGVESSGKISALNLHGGSESSAIGIALLFKRSERVIDATLRLSDQRDEAHASGI